MSLTTFSVLLYATIIVGWIGFLWIIGALIKEGVGAWRNSRKRAASPAGHTSTSSATAGSRAQGGSNGSAS